MAANMMYWFYSSTGPKKGLYVLENGIIELDFSNKSDAEKISKLNHRQIIGSGFLGADNLWAGSYTSPRGFEVYFPEKFDTSENFAKFAKQQWQEAVEQEASIQADPVALLERCLKEHDWYSAYSDDHSNWVRGNRQYKEIIDLLKKLPLEKAQELYSKYAPKDFKFPTLE